MEPLALFTVFEIFGCAEYWAPRGSVFEIFGYAEYWAPRQSKIKTSFYFALFSVFDIFAIVNKKTSNIPCIRSETLPSP